MKLIALAPETQMLTGATHKAIVKAADFAAISGASGTVQIFPATGNVPLGSLVGVIATRVVTRFDSSGDTGINSITLQVGDGASANRYLAAQEMSADGAAVDYKAGSGTFFAYTSNDQVLATITAAGGASPTGAEVNSGEAEIYLRVIYLPELRLVR